MDGQAFPCRDRKSYEKESMQTWNEMEQGQTYLMVRKFRGEGGLLSPTRQA